jgi:hypothetical protein
MEEMKQQIRKYCMSSIVSILFALACVIAMPVVSQASVSSSDWEDEEVIVSSGDWSGYLNEDGTATICGWNGNGESVEIPDKIGNYVVTGIGVSVFYDCSNLISITIPDSVTSIGEDAF